MSKAPLPTVGALIVNPEGKVLLIKSHKWHNKYVIPGGQIEFGETIKQALKREIKEETGLDIYDIQYLFCQDFIYDRAYWKKRHFVLLDFICRTNSSQVTLNWEGQEYVWASMDEIDKLPVDIYTLKVIEEFRKRQLTTKQPS